MHTVRFNRLPATALATKEATLKVVEKAVVDITAFAKIEAPVDTGALAASIDWEVQGTFTGAEGTSFTNMEYAPPQEFGWLGNPGHPFMRPSVEKVKQQIDELAHIIGHALERAARGG